MEKELSNFTRKELKKILDYLVSKIIRISESEDGYCKCITCKKTFTMAEIQCGHYISRAHLNTRYYLKNLNPQCARCNVFLQGNREIYRNELIASGIDIKKLEDKNLVDAILRDEHLVAMAQFCTELLDKVCEQKDYKIPGFKSGEVYTINLISTKKLITYKYTMLDTLVIQDEIYQKIVTPKEK